MALARRTGSRFAANIWPGFVDAMTALVLVLMFVLSIFMVVQFVLRETISGQKTQLDDLSEQVVGLLDALGLEQTRSSTLSNELGQASATLDDQSRELRLRDAMIADLTLQRNAQAARLTSAQERITALLAQNDGLTKALDETVSENVRNEAGLAEAEATLNQLRAAQRREINAKEALQLAVARLRTEIDEKDEAARLAAAQADAMQALVASLRTDVAAQTQTAQARAAEVASLTARLTEVERKQLADAAAVVAGDAEIARLRDRLSAEEAARLAQLASIAANEREITRLSASLKEGEAERLAQLARIAEREKEVATLQANLKREEELRREQLASIASNEKRIAELDESLTAAEAERLAQLSAIAARDRDLAALAERIREKDTKLAGAEEVLKAKDAALADLTQSLTAAEARRVAEAAAAAALMSRFEDETAKRAAELQAQLEAGALKAAELEKRLTDEEKLRLAQIAAADALRARLETSDTELEAMTLALEEKRKEAEETLKLLAAAEAAKTTLEASTVTALSEADRNKALVAQAEALLVEQKALSEEDQKRLALLNQQTAALRRQLSGLQALLGESEARDEAAQVQIQSLGSQLNAALAQTATAERRKRELEEQERKRLEAEANDLRKARSEFLARTRAILGAQEGVEEVGDRFVFSSEVLFGVASADLSSGGREQISRVADVIKQVAEDVPDEINWILRVDGHTDNTPLRGGRYSDNWELSQARALAVVKYLIESEGLPATRLSANGFGEYQPVDVADTPEARARNRRIEIKFTEK